MADFHPHHYRALSLPISVKDDRHYITDFACGGTNIGNIWGETKEDQASALYLDANFEKAFKIDDVSSVFHYDLITENGELNTYITGEGKGEIRCSEFDGMVCEDELTTLPLAVSISNISEDNFLDVDFAKKVPDLDCKFCDELSGGNLKSKIHSRGNCNEEIWESESSILEPRCFTDQFGKVTADKHGDSDSTCKYDDVKGLNTSSNNDIQDVSGPSIFHSNASEIGCSFSHDGEKTQFSLSSVREPCTAMSTEDVDSVSRCTEADGFCEDDLSPDICTKTKLFRTTRQKRLCRPPQRYLDGLPWLKSTLDTEKKQCKSYSKDKELGVKSKMKHLRTGLRGRPPTSKTSYLEVDSDEEYEHDESCVRKSKRGDRRKNSKPWKLDEVVALVDGISKFGIGQWTAVKNYAFSNSSRTTTDIRDKWRNLVKTNCKSSTSRKGYHNRRNVTQPLPQSLIEQVREIANALESCSNRGRRFSNGR